MKQLSLLTAILLAGAGLAKAEAPANYYKSCEGLKQKALKAQLYTLTKTHTAITYGTGSNATWTAFRYTDIDESDNTWYDIYTSNRVKVSGTSGAASGMNIEHTFPKSWWGGTKNDAYKDICHLMPANSNANSARGNLPYAEVQTESSSSVSGRTYKVGTPKAGQGGGSSKVFEPADEYKGDLARNYFYVVTCYQNLTWQSDGVYTALKGDYPTLQPWAVEMLLRWHREDPVSDKERKRNDGVYSQQKNRNPFIDHPEFVEHIWGNLQDVAWHEGEDPSNPGGDPSTPKDPVLNSPFNGDSYSAGNAELGSYTEISIPVIASNFTKNVTASIESGDASMFNIVVGSRTFQKLTITAADINDEGGYYLKIRYTPTAYTVSGTYNATSLVLTGADLASPVTVTIKGECAESVSLNAPVALEAENVTDDGYTARWLASTDDIDGYTLYRDIYLADGSGVDYTLEYDIDADETSYTVTDRDPSLKEAYRLVATKDASVSPMSNVIVVNSTTSVDSIGINEDAPAEYFTIDGIRLEGAPTEPGIYIVRRGSSIVRTVRF